MIMNTVHLSLFPPHEKARTRTRTLTRTLTKKEHRGARGVFREYEEVECDSAVEGSEMTTREVERGGSLFFQCAEGVLHVLQ